MFSKKVISLIATAFIACSVSAANAGIFTVNRAVGTATVTGTITTNGALGVLGTSDITDWDLLLAVGINNFTLLGPLSGSNSGLQVSGSALSATATDLLFDFGANGFALFQNPNVGSNQNWWCIEGPSSSCTPYGLGESVQLGNYPSGPHDTQVYRTSQVIGTTSITNVPEPFTLSLFGAGIAGAAALRRRKVAKA